MRQGLGQTFCGRSLASRGERMGFPIITMRDQALQPSVTMYKNKPEL